MTIPDPPRKGVFVVHSVWEGGKSDYHIREQFEVKPMTPYTTSQASSFEDGIKRARDQGYTGPIWLVEEHHPKNAAFDSEEARGLGPNPVFGPYDLSKTTTKVVGYDKGSTSYDDAAKNMKGARFKVATNFLFDGTPIEDGFEVVSQDELEEMAAKTPFFDSSAYVQTKRSRLIATRKKVAEEESEPESIVETPYYLDDQVDISDSFL